MTVITSAITLSVFSNLVIKAFDVVFGKVIENSVDIAWNASLNEEQKKFASDYQNALQEATKQTINRSEKIGGINKQDIEEVLQLLNSNQRVQEDLGKFFVTWVIWPDTHKIENLLFSLKSNQAHQSWQSGGKIFEIEIIAKILESFLENFRDALGITRSFDFLVQKDISRTLKALESLLEDFFVTSIQYDSETDYREQMKLWYGKARFVGLEDYDNMPKIVLKNIFVFQKFRFWQLASTEDQKDNSVGKKKKGQNDETEQDLLGKVKLGPEVAIKEVLRQSKQIVFIGDPGSGKSTLLNYLVSYIDTPEFNNLSADSKGNAYLPIFISLQEYMSSAKEKEILEFIFEQAQSKLQLNLPRNFFFNALDVGSCLVCMDGYDEIWDQDQRREMQSRIEAFKRKFPENRFIITSRRAGYFETRFDSQEWSHFLVIPFSKKETHTFVENWFSQRIANEISRASEINLFEVFINNQSTPIKDLISNPLLLTLTIFIYPKLDRGPVTRASLYKVALDSLRARRGKFGNLEERLLLTPQMEKRLIQRLAFDLYSRGEEAQRINEDAFREIVEGDALELEMVNKEWEAIELADKLVNLTKSRPGFLWIDSERRFFFSHATFQEYLAAEELVAQSRAKSKTKIWNQVFFYLDNPRWQNVLLFFLALLPEEKSSYILGKIFQADDKFEPILHRHLYFCAKALVEQVKMESGLSRRIIDAVRDIVYNGFNWQYESALELLGSFRGNSYAAEVLRDIVRDVNLLRYVRLSAASMLGNIGLPIEAETLLLGFLNDSSERYPVDVAVYLGTWGRSSKAIQSLVNLLKDEARPLEYHDSCKVAEAIGQVGDKEQAVYFLTKLSEEEPIKAAESLERLGFRENALEILQSSIEKTNLRALETILSLGFTEAALEVLEKIKNEQTSSLDRHRYIARLFLKAGQIKKSENYLLDLLEQPQLSISDKSLVLRELDYMGCLHPSYKIELVKWINNTDLPTLYRLWVAEVLDKVDSKRMDVYTFLEQVANDPEERHSFRENAAKLIGDGGNILAGINILENLFITPPPPGHVNIERRETIADSLCHLYKKENSGIAFEKIYKMAKDTSLSSRSRYKYAQYLKEPGSIEQAREILLELINNKNLKTESKSQRWAVNSLGDIRPVRMEDIDLLIQIIQGGSKNSRFVQAAYESLKKMVEAEALTNYDAN